MTLLKPLVVDLDGTLLKSDILLESLFGFLEKNPWRFYQPFLWFIQGGKTNLKAHLAERVDITTIHLPYDQEILDWLHKEKASGRKLILATATYTHYADQIAAHLNLFDHVIASTRYTNLSAKNKKNALVEMFGEKGFDYAGNSTDDLPVWESADRAFVVNPEPRVEQRARALGNVEKVIKSPPQPFKTWAKALRLHQWLKNLLIFVPLLASHQITQVDFLLSAAFAFILFGLCASSVYILNDLLDLENDRHHSTKRHRPFAAGTVSIKTGLILFPLLLVLAFAGALWLLPWQFTATLAIYYLLTLGYSLVLKRFMVIDVIALAMLYTLRIVAGAFALQLALTFWMLAFSMFIFLSLALIKRYAELHEARSQGKTQKSRGRGYYPNDLEMISSLGAASGYLSVLVLALYIHDQTTVMLYRYPEVIWLACPLLLFWISRVWLLTHRGQMYDDPIVFATQDRVSLCIAALFGLTFWIAA